MLQPQDAKEFRKEGRTKFRATGTFPLRRLWTSTMLAHARAAEVQIASEGSAYTKKKHHISFDHGKGYVTQKTLTVGADLRTIGINGLWIKICK